MRLTYFISIIYTAFQLIVQQPVKSGSFNIPMLDLAQQRHRQVIVDKEAGQYLGHPTSVLIEDGRTVIIVYPKGHGRGAIVMKKSSDGGLTWSSRIEVPKNWETSREVPTIYRVVSKEGKKRLVLFSGLYPIRSSFSEDNGASWTPLKPIGEFGGIVAMASLEQIVGGDYLAFFHDDGRFFTQGGKSTGVFTVYSTVSRDGGMTWEFPKKIFSKTKIHLCEPGIIRSPNGKQLAMLLRENSRTRNSFISFSDDEGGTWSEPRELPLEITGDRHTAKYAPDGRLFISFRDMASSSPTKGDWVAWVGTFADIKSGSKGQYRIRLMQNFRASDCAYPGVEVLPDGTILSTTYGHWEKEQEPYIVAVRLKLSELDAMVK